MFRSIGKTSSMQEELGSIPVPRHLLLYWYLIIQPSIEFSQADVVQSKQYFILKQMVLKESK